MPRVPRLDPADAVMVDPQVPEGRRFCSRCDAPVGRGAPDRPGRTEGFCPRCGLGYSFTPKLRPGDMVAGQYEVIGCLAHGGLGWIYLAGDRQVADRRVVLKGLLDSGDTDAMAAAVAERRFLAAVQHPNIVEIYNFVEHFGAGYIVMEYVDGRSLKDLLLERREATGGSLPLPQVLAYGLEVLQALGHLHDLGLLFCDFKPDNALHSEGRLRLIDLGGVRHAGDEHSPIYGTTGYQAPEIAESGPSVASDLYTVARTMAVLSFEFHGYTGRYRYSLPDRDTVPLLVKHESFDRFLRRATHADRRERFGSAAEMAEQLTGVLREVLAAEDGRPRPAGSVHFQDETTPAGTRGGLRPSPAAMAAALPWPVVGRADWLASTLGRVREYIERGEFERARRLPASGADDWRITWCRGVTALAEGDPAAAAVEFSRVYDRLPGEAEPQLALAFCAELTDDLDLARRSYLRVWRTRRTHVSAVFGLARVSVDQGDRANAVAVLASVPPTSAHRTDAQVGAVLAALRGRDPADLGLAELMVAAGRVEALDLDPGRRARLAALVLEAALGQVVAGRPLTLGPDAGKGPDVLLADGVEALGRVLDERDLRLALEGTYRELARAVDVPVQRLGLVERANAVRPRTLT